MRGVQFPKQAVGLGKRYLLAVVQFVAFPPKDCNDGLNGRVKLRGQIVHLSVNHVIILFAAHFSGGQRIFRGL